MALDISPIVFLCQLNNSVKQFVGVLRDNNLLNFQCNCIPKNLRFIGHLLKNIWRIGGGYNDSPSQLTYSCSLQLSFVFWSQPRIDRWRIWVGHLCHLFFVVVLSQWSMFACLQHCQYIRNKFNLSLGVFLPLMQFTNLFKSVIQNIRSIFVRPTRN